MKTHIVIILLCAIFAVSLAFKKASKDAEILETPAEKDGDLKTSASYGYGYSVGYPLYSYASYYPYYGHYGSHWGGYGYPYHGGYYGGYGWPYYFR